uniref:Peptidase S1 domain-containing protein n=1 Tax=Anopheles dirus TaxID=7168 RepID=A0A182NIQ9_9DIPT
MAKVQEVLLLSLTIACALCAAIPHAGRRIQLPDAHKTPRIRGGIPVGPEEIPYAAGLMIQQPIGNRWCGGSLVSLNYVLTAASCFSNPGATTVLLGASNMTNVEDIVMASEIIVHQAFAPGQNLHDIALVRLSRPAILSNYIRLARLPNWRQADSQFVGQLATVAGWGALGQNAPEILPLNNLHRVDGAVVTNTACNLQYLGGISDSHVCVSTTNGSPCQGDHGGPLTVQDADGGQTVIGVFSFVSVLGCDLDRPAVYTRLTMYLPWIEANSDVTIRIDFEFFPTPPNAQTTTAGTPEPTHQDTTPLPTTTTVQPEQTTPLPTTTTVQPEQTTPLPTTTTVQPEQTTDLPITTTLEPEQTTVQPVTTTVDTTVLPITTTVEPEETTTVQAFVPPHRTNRPDIRIQHHFH